MGPGKGTRHQDRDPGIKSRRWQKELTKGGGACDGQALGPSGLGLWVAPANPSEEAGLGPHPNSPNPAQVLPELQVVFQP